MSLRGSIPRLVARALAPVLEDLTYQEVAQVPVDADKAWEGTTEAVRPHRCRGYVGEFSRAELASSLVEANDRKVVVVADSLDVEPDETGRVVVSGRSLAVVSVRSDPLRATWEIQARA